MPRRRLPLGLALALSVSAGAFAQQPRLATLERLAKDPAPSVRLEAVRALAKIRDAKSAEIALGVLEQPMDPALDYALWLTINELAEPWIAALESGAWKPEGRERQLEFALKSIPPEQASRVLSRVLAARPIDGTGPWIELIGQAGTPAELRLLVKALAGGSLQPEAAQRAVRALTEANRARKHRVEGDAAAVGALLGHADAGVRGAALGWVGQIKDAGRVPQVGEMAGGDAAPAVRSAAFATLRQIGGPSVAALLKGMVGKGSAEFRASAVSTLAALDAGAAVGPAVELLPAVSDEASALALWRGLLAQKSMAKPLATAIEARAAGSPKFVPETVARAGMRVAREGGRNEMELVLALAKGAGLAADAQAFTAGLIKELAAKAAASGDPGRGEWIYRRDSIGCVGCHAIGGAGGKVGPDMTSIGASAPVDYLVESILTPNVKIKEGYHSVELTLKDGTEYVGTLARETPTEVVLRNAAGAEQAVPKSEISKREQGTASLMPAGLIDPLPEQEQLDLVAFLSQLGKPGLYDASRGGVARRWRLAQTVHTDAQAGKEGWPLQAAFSDKRWLATWSFVRGSLPKAALEEVAKGQPWTGRLGLFAATEVQVATAGSVNFNLTAAPGAELWVGARKVGGPGKSSVELPAGRHRVVVKMDPRQVPEWLRLETAEAAFVLE